MAQRDDDFELQPPTELRRWLAANSVRPSTAPTPWARRQMAASKTLRVAKQEMAARELAPLRTGHGNDTKRSVPKHKVSKAVQRAVASTHTALRTSRMRRRREMEASSPWAPRLSTPALTRPATSASTSRLLWPAGPAAAPDSAPAEFEGDTGLWSPIRARQRLEQALLSRQESALRSRDSQSTPSVKDASLHDASLHGTPFKSFLDYSKRLKGGAKLVEKAHDVHVAKTKSSAKKGKAVLKMAHRSIIDAERMANAAMPTSEEMATGARVMRGVEVKDLGEDELDAQMLGLGRDERPGSPLFVLAHNAQHYTGDVGKKLFAAASRRVARHADADPPPPSTPGAAMHGYLSALDNGKLLALPAVLKQRGNQELSLGGAGLGDNYGKALTAALTHMPHLVVVNISDNRLKDKSMSTIVQAVATLPSVVTLNLSSNRCGQATASAVIAALSHRAAAPALQTLALANCSVTDALCAPMAHSLHRNTTLLSLDLSGNSIGRSELQNIVNPELVTGGEAIATMLQSNTTLATLLLHDNLIRADSALAMAKALSANVGLTALELGSNGFGDVATQAIGAALANNNRITSLGLSRNAIGPRGAMVLACALGGGFGGKCALVTLDLSANPLHVEGTGALLAALTRAERSEPRSIKINFAQCDVSTSAETGSVFNVMEPTGLYELDLSSSYDSMVANELHRLALTRSGCRYMKIEHQPPPVGRRRARWEKIVLARDEKSFVPPEVGGVNLANEGASFEWAALSNEIRDKKAISQASLAQILSAMRLSPRPDVLKEILTDVNENIRLALEESAAKQSKHSSGPQRPIRSLAILRCVFYGAFDLVDGDASGAIDHYEMADGLCCLGAEGTDEELFAEARSAIALYDDDGSGFIERAEFSSYMLNHRCSLPMPKQPPYRNAKTGDEWNPPLEGTLKVQYLAEPSAAGSSEARDHGMDNAVRTLVDNICAAPSDEERTKLFLVLTRSCDLSFTAEQMIVLVDRARISIARLELIARILPLAAHPHDAVEIIDHYVSADEKVNLRLRLGNAWRPIVGAATGHYFMDLSVTEDRYAAKKLAELAELSTALPVDRAFARQIARKAKH